MKVRAKKTDKKTNPAKTVLMVYGGWDGHEPRQCMERFSAWLAQRGFTVRVSDSLDAYLDKGMLDGVDVIVPMWTMGRITGEQRAALCAAVRGGVGLAGWHGGMCDAFRDDTEYQFMTGGQWVAHPGNIVNYRVENLDAEDPITRGLKAFTMVSEQYYMHTDPGNVVLGTTTFSGRHAGVSWIRGTVMPVVWRPMYGKGRVFYTSLGHVNADFDVPEAFEIVRRGIQWAARLRIRPEYVSS